MIAVLDYGIGNLRSATKALEAVGAEARLTSDPDLVAAADGVVLPGVGAFGRCMEALVASGLDHPARLAAESGVPFLGICVGMQLLYEGSEETPGVEGLGVVPGCVVRLPAGVKHPQMQWNRLQARGPSPLLDPGDPGWYYFVHSYAAPKSELVIATCDYGAQVPAMIQRDRLWATQFHPEKSGKDGLALLRRFAQMCGAQPGQSEGSSLREDG